MSEYKLRKRAEADLAEIWRYTAARWNADQAERYTQKILAALTALASDPNLGRSCDEIRPGIFRREAGSHVIFFRKAEPLEIVRILRARRDFRRHLPKK
jgi:toxin ParE1/3/4